MLLLNNSQYIMFKFKGMKVLTQVSTKNLKNHAQPNLQKQGLSISPSTYNWLDNIHIYSGKSRQPADIAHELGIPTGAVINPIVCGLGDDELVVVLMAGDKGCDPEQVSKALSRAGDRVMRLNETQINQRIGINLENLFAIQLAEQMPVVIDASLKRFDKLYSKAGGRKCLIETTYAEIKTLTKGIVSYGLSSAGPIAHT